MNLKEGMRRLALVAGVVGAAGGVCLSYADFGKLRTQRAQHDEFQYLLSRPLVQREVRFLKNELPKAKEPGPWLKYAHHGQDWFDAAAAISGSTDG